MVLVMVFTLISLLSLTAGYDRLHQLFAFEEASYRVGAGSDGIQEALGQGLARFVTGQPTVDADGTYSCNLRLRASDGEVIEFTLVYQSLADNEWSLVAEAGGGIEADCPASFTDDTCPAPVP